MSRILYFCSLVILLLSFSNQLYANAWPVFLLPDEAFLLQNGFIDRANCPSGQGKLLNNQIINIAQTLCKTFCPNDWEWKSASKEKCLPIETNFTLLNYQIEYERDTDGTVIDTKIDALYGDAETNKTHFIFSFITPAQNWYCFESSSNTHAITCANDV